MRGTDNSMKQNIYKTISTFLLALSIALLSMPTHAQVQDNNGTVSSVNGYATVTDSDGNVKRLKEGDSINIGDVINTGSTSSLEITLSDGQVISIGELASFTFSNAAIAASIADADLGSGSSGTASLGQGSSSLSAAVSAGGSPVE